MNRITRVRRAAKNPIKFARGVNRLYHRRFGRRDHNTAGVAVMDEDWDTLLILDACRYDLFATESDLPGRLESRRSRGSSTAEFLHANLTDRDLRDTVYVTANPQFQRHRDAIGAEFHDVVDVGRDHWNDEYGTVLPEAVTDAATRANREYPEKRLLVHYLQPHYPFVPAADEDAAFRGFDSRIWERLFTETLDIPRHEVWRAYANNLEYVLPSVRTLLETIEGKTVVTADHGNMVGERAFPLPIREWGHPRGIYTDELVTVPWLISENGDRRTITAADPVTETESDTDDEVVSERLQALGYAE